MPGRSYTAGKFGLELQGAAVGFAHSVEGGEPFGVVVDEVAAGGTGKRVAEVRSAPLVLDVALTVAAPFLAWLDSMLDGTQTPKSGAIGFLDYNLHEVSRLEWTSALITEVTFPAADGTSKDSAFLRVTIQPTSSRMIAGSGSVYAVPNAAMAQKQMRSSNFRFSIAGLPSVATKVTKVSPIVVRRNVIDAATSSADASDLAFWLPAFEAGPVQDWFDDFVLDGHNDAGSERTGSLAFLEPNSAGELMRIEFDGVGIFRITHDRNEDNAAVLPLVKVEMYCESVSLAGPPAAAPPTPPPTGEDVVGRLAKELVAALRQAPSREGLTDDAVATRLLASVESRPARDAGDRGRQAGREWASWLARLDELEVIAALAGHDNWKAVALAEGHSLIDFLAANGDLLAGETGPVDLTRDEFTAGLVTGAAEVYREIAPRLGESRRPEA